MTMRIDHNLINWNAPLDDIRDHTEFDAVFTQDLLKARFSVQAKSPFIGLPRLQRLGEPLLGLPERGVRLCIFIRVPDAWEVRNSINTIDAAKARRIEDAINLLEAAGAHINLIQGIHQKVCVMDGCVVYRGSLNILSFYNSEEEMMRKVNAKEALQAMTYSGIDRCFCAGPPAVELLANPDIIGQQLLRIRESLNLTQEQVCETLNKIDPSLLSRIESQKREPSFRQVAQIGEALGRGVGLLLPSQIHYLDQIECVMRENATRSR